MASTPTPSFVNRSPSRSASCCPGMPPQPGCPARVLQGSASGPAELFWGTGTYYLPSNPSVSAVAAFWEPGGRPWLPEVVAEEMSHHGYLGEVTRVVQGPQPADGSRGFVHAERRPWAGRRGGFSLPPKRDTEAEPSATEEVWRREARLPAHRVCSRWLHLVKKNSSPGNREDRRGCGLGPAGQRPQRGRRTALLQSRWVRGGPGGVWAPSWFSPAPPPPSPSQTLHFPCLFLLLCLGGTGCVRGPGTARSVHSGWRCAGGEVASRQGIHE